MIHPIKNLFIKILIATVLFSSLYAFAQEIGEYEDFKPGDVLTYSTKAEGKAGEYIFSFTEVQDGAVKGVTTFMGKKMQFESPAHGYLGKEFCLAEVAECQWTPPAKLFDKNDKLNDKSKMFTRVDIKGTDTAYAEEELSNTVEKIEKIKVPAGEFNAFKVKTTGTIKAVLKNGKTYPGTLNMTTWYGVVNQRMVMIKREYTNSFKGDFMQELSKIPEIAK